MLARVPSLAVLALVASVSMAPPAPAQELVFASPVTDFELDPATFIPTILDGDFDEDGRTDVLLVEGVPLRRATALLGQAGGGFATGPVSSLNSTGDVALIADLDGDGHLDLLGNGIGFGLAMAVGLGAGDGSFGPGLGIPEAQPFTFVSLATAGDLDLDGDLDVVATRPYAQVLRNAGDGTFTSGGSLSGEATAFVQPRAIALADLADDGTPDLVVGMSDSLQRIHAGLPGGTLTVEPELLSLGTVPSGTPGWSFGSVVADVDGDGVLDLAQTHTGDFSLQMRPGLGDGSFGPEVTSPFLSPPSFNLNQAGRIRLGDWDGDGTTDAAVLVPGRLEVHLLRGLGGGAFEASAIVSAQSAVRHAVVLDVDQDGREDLMGTRQAFGLVTIPDAVVFRNATYTAAEPFVDLGDALPGTRGYPVQLAEGSLTFATPLTIRLENGLPGATPFLVVGLSALELPFKSGVLWPQVEFIQGTAPVDSQGKSEFPAIWLATAGGFDLWFQYWFADMGAPAGFAATSGVRASVP
jgi:hypothetical protein